MKKYYMIIALIILIMSSVYAQSGENYIPQIDNIVNELAKDIHRKLVNERVTKVAVSHQFSFRGSVPPLVSYWVNQFTGELANIPNKPYILLSDGPAGADFRLSGEIIEITDVIRVYTNTKQLLAKDDDSTDNNRKRIIVSHHVPTALCMADEFKNSRINGAFVAELHDFIYDHRIEYWIYGHSHRNMPEIDINDTIMLCNQLGYVQSKEHMTFNRQAYFEINNK
jgi:hypothetical protein